MKNDFLTTIVIAVVGVIGGFLITNMLVGEIKSATVKTLEEGVSADLAEPNPEIFNYRALNPTVEVYVGNCDKRNEFGECVEENTDPYIDEGQQIDQEEEE